MALNYPIVSLKTLQSTDIAAHKLAVGAESAESVLYDLWESMREHDQELADAVLEPTFTFMRAQTDHSRVSISELGRYLEYRERDVGKA